MRVSEIDTNKRATGHRTVERQSERVAQADRLWLWGLQKNTPAQKLANYPDVKLPLTSWAVAAALAVLCSVVVFRVRFTVVNSVSTPSGRNELHVRCCCRRQRKADKDRQKVTYPNVCWYVYALYRRSFLIQCILMRLCTGSPC